MARYSRKSRLARHERKVFTRQAVVFLGVALGLIYAVFQWGIPALIKLAVFLGDIRSGSQIVEQADTVAPIAPRFEPLPTATYSASLVVRGLAEAGTTVKVYVNNQVIGEVVTSSEGEFVVEKVELDQGENAIWAMATDPTGNKSRDSAVVKINRDDVAPEIVFESPTEGLVVTEETVEVKGKVSEPAAAVTVSGRLMIVNSTGTFSTKVNLNEGENKIVVVAVDRAGNEKTYELSVSRQE